MQWAILWPLLLLLTLGIIQAGIFLHGRNVATAAATAAVDAARGSYGSAADAEQLGATIAGPGACETFRYASANRVHGPCRRIGVRAG